MKYVGYEVRNTFIKSITHTLAQIKYVDFEESFTNDLLFLVVLLKEIKARSYEDKPISYSKENCLAIVFCLVIITFGVSIQVRHNCY